MALFRAPVAVRGEAYMYGARRRNLREPSTCRCRLYSAALRARQPGPWTLERTGRSYTSTCVIDTVCIYSRFCITIRLMTILQVLRRRHCVRRPAGLNPKRG